MAKLTVVLDASAVLALLLQEPGYEKVSAVVERGEVALCSVSLAEVIGKLVDKGMAPDLAAQAVAELELHVVPFDHNLALEVARLRPLTRKQGLSLGDHCCLATAKHLAASAMTADKIWATLKVKIKIHLIR